MNKNKLLFSFFLFFTLGSFSLIAQVTTSSMTGVVKDNNGETLVGATIQATHVPSGTTYGVITQSNGSYTIPHMRIGGPYKVETSYLGYQSEATENIYLALGEKYKLDLEMREEGVTLDDVVVTAAVDDIVNGKRTGAETSISTELLATLPTISRSAEDYTRLNPMAAEGGSFAGRNDQFNNYSLNGTIFNNPFGLDAATPGGQSNAQPISLDAIEQIQVSIAPYDVTQSGFTGAAINAVTKSGTNDFHGTVYGFLNTNDLIGSEVAGVKAVNDDFKSNVFGASVGGPIMKNKAFFFVNFEMQNRSNSGTFGFVPDNGTNSGGANVSRVLQSDLDLVSNLLAQNFNYQTGASSGFTHDSDNVKGLIRLDFNLNQNHSLSASYNFLDAFREQPAHPSAIGPRGPNLQTLQFENTGYRINNKLHSGIIELKSLFGSNMANKLSLTYSAFRDNRDPFSNPFPVINIGKDGARYIIAGHEPFSVNNVLDQDVFQIRNDFNLYKGKHTFTFGGSFERFNFNNSFNLTAYGARVFFPDIDIADVTTVFNSPEFAGEVAAAQAAFETNNRTDNWALAETNLGQFSIYAQDEIQVNDKLNLTVGLRVDAPLYFNTPDLIQENIDRKGGLFANGGTYDPNITYFDEDGNSVMFDHTELPENNILFNPRVGFNYDIRGDRTMQLRGGTGLFSGRFPFVWIGNQVANPDFFFYNTTDPDFKFPQVWRTNVGYDQKFGEGWVASVDLLYTKDLQAQMVRNYGLNLPTGRLQGVDNRPIYQASDRATNFFGDATNAYVFTNADEGYSFNASFQIERSWNNTYIKFGYNYLNAKDVASIDAEISSDAYDRNPGNIAHTNRAELAPSLYGNRHRFLGAATKKFNYGKWGTTLSLFFEYVEGGRYSYTYAGDINNDGSGLNDLLYVPTDGEIDQMNFSGNATQQRADFKTYIAQDEYLSGRRGQYAEKYGALEPWYSNWDFRVLQDYQVSDDNKIQFSMDILNIGNLLNSDWGVRQSATQTSLAQPVSVAVANGDPTYTFNADPNQTFFNDFAVLSRWRIQFGLRYIF